MEIDIRQRNTESFGVPADVTNGSFYYLCFPISSQMNADENMREQLISRNKETYGNIKFYGKGKGGKKIPMHFEYSEHQIYDHAYFVEHHLERRFQCSMQPGYFYVVMIFKCIRDK